jgi:hypothetical protein
MELTIDEFDRYLNVILSGKKIIEVEGLEVILEQPSVFLKMRGDLVYKNAYKEAVKEGLLPRADLVELIKKRNIISDEELDQLSRLESKLEAQRILLAKTTKVKANQDRIKKIISDLEDDIFSIKEKELSKLMMSAETKAEEDRYNFLCSVCAYSYGKLIWPSYTEYNKETRIIFKDKILGQFIVFYNGIKTDIIRHIARHNLWRVRYTTSSKVSDPLFGRSTAEYTTDMLNLAFWSNYYQQVYEMLPDDRPPDSIIDDDEALDAYMNSYYEEQQKESMARKAKRKTGGKLSAFDQEEVIVTQSNELYEDIKYDKPREAQRIKDKVDIKKRTRNR